MLDLDTSCLAHRGGLSMKSFFRCEPEDSFGPPEKALDERGK